MTNQASIDIESLSLKKNALVLTVGLRIFTLDTDPGPLGRGFHFTMDLAAQARRDVSLSTALWWFRDNPSALLAIARHLENAQDPQAPMTFARNGGDIYYKRLEPDALAVQLAGAWDTYKPEQVWFKGPQFDEVVLQDLLGGRVPWKHNEVRDVRTLSYALERHVPFEDKPVAHDALADATEQALRVIRLQGFLRGLEEQSPKANH